jgi:hypothetical protein
MFIKCQLLGQDLPALFGCPKSAVKFIPAVGNFLGPLTANSCTRLALGNFKMDSDKTGEGQNLLNNLRVSRFT